jgi:hypothetical protein
VRTAWPLGEDPLIQGASPANAVSTTRLPQAVRFIREYDPDIANFVNWQANGLCFCDSCTGTRGEKIASMYARRPDLVRSSIFCTLSTKYHLKLRFLGAADLHRPISSSVQFSLSLSLFVSFSFFLFPFSFFLFPFSFFHFWFFWFFGFGGFVEKMMIATRCTHAYVLHICRKGV